MHGKEVFMFEPISQSLYELMMFSILGFFLGALYEPLRIVRLFVRTGALITGIGDFLFLAASGLIVFAYSLEFGGGHFRYFYVFGVVFGATLYFLTLGKLINFLTRTFADAIKAYILRPLCKILVKIAQKTKVLAAKFRKNAEKHGKALINTIQIKYNSRTRRIKEVKINREVQDGGTKTAVKARVIRKT